jgi:hypothetical protein
MAVLVELFYDLTCRDLAPEFEDNNEVFAPVNLANRLVK